ncbi:MAG: succinate dehydrogenase, cytochrome b556 subunit [Anaerolineae bacterium]
MGAMNSAVTFVSKTLTYRGGRGHWSWILHRLGGVGIATFLLLHIVDIFLVGLNKYWFNSLLFIYHAPVLRPAIWALTFGVFYHAFNGLRIIAQDFWPGLFRYQKQLALAVWIIVALLVIPLIGADIRSMLSHL